MQAAGGAALTTQPTHSDDALDTTSGVLSGPVRRRRFRALRTFTFVVLVVLGLDIAVKQYTVTVLADREPVRLLGGVLNLVHVRNSGAAFSMGEGYTFIFPIVAFGVIGWILWMMRSVASTPWGLALALILGGAAGNLGDRLFRAPGPFRGHVVDMFKIGEIGSYQFPVFNVADSALCVGVTLAVLLELTGRGRDGNRVPNDRKPKATAEKEPDVPG